MTALDRLRTIAAQATPGPWKQDERDGLWGYVYSPTETEEGADIAQAYWSDTDATFIATFDPPTVMALLDVAEAAGRLVSGKVMGEVHARPGRDADYCDSCLRSWPCEGSQVQDALDWLREVTS